MFFIPIFPHDSVYWYYCPVCNYGVRLENDEFESYRSIAEINSAFLEKKISEIERVKQLEEIYITIEHKTQANRLKQLEESKNFYEQVISKTNDELLNILNDNRSGYDPAFIIAVEEEIKRRQ